MNKQKTIQFLKGFIHESNEGEEFISWFYQKGLKAMEDLLGPEEYLRLVTFDFRRSSVEAIKRMIIEVLPQELKSEIES